jgi:hypothetical protein
MFATTPGLRVQMLVLLFGYSVDDASVSPSRQISRLHQCVLTRAPLQAARG